MTASVDCPTMKPLFDRFGFIVMDGNGALFGTLHGNTRDVLHKFSVDLPKKHGRGGQVKKITSQGVGDMTTTLFYVVGAALVSLASDSPVL